MRKIQLEDAFSVMRLIKKAGLKDTIKEAVISGRENGASDEEIGIKVVFELLDAAGNKEIQNEIYELFGNISEQGADAIKSMSLNGAIEFLKRFEAENDLKSFFTALKALMK